VQNTEKELNELNAKLNEFAKENESTTLECIGKKKDFEKKSKLSEKLKTKFEEFEKEDINIRQEVKHAKEQIKKLEKNITTETEKASKNED
jgi:predicted  nucleic acid-binding Zn-ribbon protein